MKKLMTSTIILLPLLILAIMLVSGAIMSIIVHIYVEKVEFVKSETLVLVMKDETLPPTEQLQINVFPYEADNRDVVFFVEDEEVASVDERGVVTANYFGETFVTVTSKENGAASATRKILVTDNSVHAVKIKEFPTDLYRGDEPWQLLAEVLPYEANNKALLWTSSDPSVLSVTQSGDVICKGAGTVTITASSVEKPEITASVTIRCHEPLASLAAEVNSVVTAQTKAQFPTLIPTPANATYTVSYSSSDENIAVVSEQGEIKFYKAGLVTVTATATDERGHSDQVPVKYNCTNGYYMGALFEKTSYTFDYDTFVGKTLEDIRLQKAPDGSYREIVSVNFSKEGILYFDKTTDTFKLQDVPETTSLGLVTITINAKKYDYESAKIKEFITDVCEVTFIRHAKTISFDFGGNLISEAITTSSSLSLTEIKGESAKSGIGVLAMPMNHTDRISYEVTGDAHMEKSIIVFDRAGKATLSATAKDENGKVTATGTLFISYTEPIDTDKNIPVSEKTAELFTSLAMHENGTKETGVLEIATPAGMTARCTSDTPSVVQVEGDNRLVPKRGGFATIVITFESNFQGVTVGGFECRVRIYVDKEVSPKDIRFNIEDELTTSKESIEYVVTLNVSSDAMEGKSLFIDGEEKKWELQGKQPVCRAVKVFPKNERSETIKVSIGYNAEAEKVAGKKGEICSSDCKVYTTHGNLIEPPKVTVEDRELSTEETTALHFSDLGEEIVIKIDTTSSVPSDFELKSELISFTTAFYFNYKVEVTGNFAAITLTAKEGGTENTTLQVAGKSYPISIDVLVAAHNLELKFGDQTLDEGTEYTTLLSTIDLTVNLSREDGEAISDRTVFYSRDGENWESIPSNGKTCKLTLPTTDHEKLIVKSGKAEYTLQLKKLDLSSLDFTFHIEYSNNDKVTLEDFKFDKETHEFSFPKAMLGSFDICIQKPELQNNLGGYDEGDMKKYFQLEFQDKAHNWEYEVSAEPSKITVKIPTNVTYFLDEIVTLKCGEKSVKLILNYSDVAFVEMPGFNSTVFSDVYLGYQQVRVFAKHSQYKENEKVDYFRVPLHTKKDMTEENPADPASITWILSTYKNGEGQELTKQRGYKVVYKGETYTIEKQTDGSSLLKRDKDNTVIAQNGKFANGEKVTWVDVFAADGYADIYFGDFKGLSESDVQNDYFGNFGDEEKWEKTPTVADDQSGRTFTPSEGAYSFLRVEAGDGVKESKVNTHYNFNVLEDDALVNVFDANGYLNNKKVVLHNNLYGPEEQTDNSKIEGQTINSTSNTQLGKELIFGNGYQVNFEAMNKSLSQSLGQQENTGTSGITFGSVYNVNLKGTNPTDKISCATHKILLIMKGAYYSDLQYYSKMNPSGGKIFFKNTVLHNVANAALQLWWDKDDYTAKHAYFENVVMANCMRGLSIEGLNSSKVGNLYFKGLFDILNYSSAKGLQDKFNAINGGNTYSSAITEEGTVSSNPFLFGEKIPGIKDIAKKYLEWFGKNGTAVDQEYRYYINMGFTEYGATSKTWVWNEKSDTPKYSSETSDVTSSNYNFGKLALNVGFENLYIKTLNTLNTIDGGKEGFTDRDTAQLFTSERHTRLLCQYKTINKDSKELEENSQHILWHMQQAYRDTTKIENRKEHIEDLKESLKGTDWPDGTGIDKDGNLHEANAAAAQLAAMIGETVLPEKREYA